MKKIIVTLLFMITIGLNSILTYASANNDRVELEATTSSDELTNYIAGEFEKMHVPAMSVEVVNGDSIEYSKNFGECTSEDPFVLGSISKSFTAVAIMQLKEQGKINLDLPVATYLPETDQNSKTTIRQLLHHTSGIHTYMTSEHYTMSDTEQEYEYANVNYNLLGQIIEKVSGMSYGEYIKANIFEPLGMTKSYVTVHEAIENNLICGYSNYFGFMIPNRKIYPADMKTSWMSASSAYLVSTSNDMGKYLQMYLNEGGDILSGESIEEIFGNTTEVQENYQYGLGWGIDRSSGPVVCLHGGNVENFTTFMIILPEYDKAIIVLSNACDFFVANEMVISTAYNIADKYMCLESRDIAEETYWKSHTLINVLLMLLFISSILPLILFVIWGRKSKKGFTVIKTTGLILVHVILPSIYLTIPSMLGGPLWVAARFAPDVFMVIVVSAMLLYLTGVWKLVAYGMVYRKHRW